MVGTEIKFQVAATGDIHRIADSIRVGLKKGMHLVFGFKIKLIGSEFQAVGIMNGFTGLDAQQNIMGTHILSVQVMAVIAGDQRYRQSLTHV